MECTKKLKSTIAYTEYAIQKLEKRLQNDELSLPQMLELYEKLSTLIEEESKKYKAAVAYGEEPKKDRRN